MKTCVEPGQVGGEKKIEMDGGKKVGGATVIYGEEARRHNIKLGGRTTKRKQRRKRKKRKVKREFKNWRGGGGRGDRFFNRGTATN